MSIKRKKKTSRKKAGLSPKEKHKPTQLERMNFAKDKKKAIEMAKPEDIFSDAIWLDIQTRELQLEKLKEKLLSRAKVARRNGYRFKHFKLIDETEIDDNAALQELFFEKLWVIPTHEVFDWKAARRFLEDNDIPIPKKKRVAYIRKVK